MTTYENLKDKPKRFLALTGYTLEEFLALLPHFSKCFLEFVETHLMAADGKNASTPAIKMGVYQVLKINWCLFRL